jgi:general secretion pathway protein G
MRPIVAGKRENFREPFRPTRQRGINVQRSNRERPWRFWTSRSQRQNRADAGYTLLELLVVLAILAVLSAMATPQLMGYFGKAKTQSAQIQIQNIETALEMYYLENGVYPSESAGLKALVEPTPEAPNWNGPYLKKAQNLLDPWRRPFQYVYPSNSGSYEIFSLGPSGKPKTASAAAIAGG